jgi:hypothetical protein
MTPTRGERNNNPGNVERNKTQWKGMSPDQSSDPRFVVFTSAVWGIRALAKIMLTYSTVYPQDSPQDIDTVREIVNRWAPPSENDTGAYVKDVCAHVGVQPGDVIDVTDEPTMCKLVKAIIDHENGRCVYDDDLIEDGVRRALA